MDVEHTTAGEPTNGSQNAAEQEHEAPSQSENPEFVNQLQRIHDYRIEVLRRVNTQSAVLGAMSCDLTEAGAHVAQYVLQGLRAGGLAAEDPAILGNGINQMIRLAKQSAQIAQLEMRTSIPESGPDQRKGK